MTELADLFSVIEGDTDFDQVCETYKTNGKDGPDNQCGPEPIGEWQFAVYCTGTISKRGLARTKVERAIPDPRGDVSYPTGDACLWYLPKELPADLINEDWPLEYAKFVKDPVRVGTGAFFVCKRHPALFVHVHNDTP